MVDMKSKMICLVLLLFIALGSSVRAQSLIRFEVNNNSFGFNSNGEGDASGENNMSGSSFGQTYIYDQSSLPLTTKTLLLLDKVVANKILLANLDTSALKIIFFGKNYETKKIWRLPESAYLKDFSIQSVEFYPSEKNGSEIVPGTLIVRTSKGDIFVDLKDFSAKFMIYSKGLFQERINADEIPVKEIN